MGFPQGAVPGIDVSHLQGVADWPTVAGNGNAFVICKASEGNTVGDAYFHDNWNGVKQAGMLRGAYHFYHPNDDPQTQANNFLKALTAANAGTPVLAPGDLPVTLDLEITGGVSPANVLAGATKWLSLIAAATGRTPQLYTFVSFWRDTLGNPKSLSEYPLWIAQYNNAASPTMVGGWASWTHWQYSSSHTVPGIGVPVDANAHNGTLDTLKALAGM